MPSAARARPAFVCGADTSLRSHRPLPHNDSTPVRLPYVLSPPAMEPQTSTKHPALWLRGGVAENARPRIKIARKHQKVRYMSDKYMGSSLDNFLQEESLFEEIQAQAIKEIIAWYVSGDDMKFQR
jgi:hypothetical protein